MGKIGPIGVLVFFAAICLAACGGGESRPASAPDIAIVTSTGNDTAVAFGTIQQGSSHDEIITIENRGNATLALGTIGGINGVTAPFSIVSDSCSGRSLASSATCRVTLRFAPVGTGSFSDSFDIPSNDQDENPRTVSMEGTGSVIPVPNIVVTDTVEPVNDLLVSFGTVTAGTTLDRTIAVSNNGTGNLVLGSIAGIDPVAAPFSKTNDTCSLRTLAPGENCILTFRFAPTQARLFADALDIPSDDPDTATVTIATRGNGVAVASIATPSAKLSADTPADFANPRIVFNNTGKAVAVWDIYGGTGSKALLSYYNGTTWSPGRVLRRSDYNTKVQIATNGTDFMVVWYDGQMKVVTCSSAGVVGTPVIIDAHGGDDPQIASNGAGYAVTWAFYDYGIGRSIYVSIYDGSSWSAKTSIETGNAQAYYPQIASNGTGYAVTWLQSDGTADSIYANVYSGNSWTAAATIETSNAPANYPQIASNGAGYAVTWQEEGGGISANVFTGSSWCTAATIQTGATEGREPQIASNSTGYAVTWRQSNGIGWNIHAAVYDGSSWASATEIDTGSDNASCPRIASNGTGYAVTWLQSDGMADSVHANIYSGSSWEGAGTTETGSGAAMCPLITRSGTGYGAIWKQNDESNFPNVYVSTYSGFWSTPGSAVSGFHRGGSRNPQFTTNSLGTTVAVWEQWSKGEWLIYGNVHSEGTWAAPFLIASGFEPQVATNGTDFMVVVWVEGSSISAIACSSTGSFGTPVSITSNGYRPRIASNGTGYAVTWAQQGINVSIYDGSSWNAPKPVGTGYSPEIASNGSGYAVTWQTSNGTEQYITASIYSGSSWTTATTIESTTIDHDSSSPQIASNGTGYAVTWSRKEQDSWMYTPQYSIFASVYNISSWTTATTLKSGRGDAHDPKITSNGTGYAVTWTQREFYDSINVNMYSESSWSTAVAVVTDSYHAYGPAIAASGVGYAVAWLQMDAPVYSIYGSFYDGSAWAGGSPVENSDAWMTQGPLITSNGNGYSVLWLESASDDWGFADVWVKIGL